MIKYDSSLLHIGKNRQLFFDNKIIERVQDITRVYHTPKAEPEPLIKADKPWEKITYFCLGTYMVNRDSTGKWHCWYGLWDFDPRVFAERNDWFDVDSSLQRVCYASSEDGINWVKPEFNIKIQDGNKTNIIIGDKQWGSFYIMTPIEDPFEKDPSKRFKTLGVHASNKIYRIEAAYSSDGINWEFYDQLPNFGTWGPCLDDEVMLGYDPISRLYTATVRSPYMYTCHLTPNSPSLYNNFVGPMEPGAWWHMNKRRIHQCESPDLIHWSQPYPIFTPDDIDNLDESYYGMCQTRIGDTLIGFVNLFRECDNRLMVRLAYSYDGKNWEFANQRQPWLESSIMSGKEWDSVMVYLGVPPIEVGDEYWFYYGGAKNHHDWYLTGVMEGLEHPEATDMSRVGYHLGLAKLRLDGFVSLNTSPLREGLIVTRPMHPEGECLVINAKTENDGYIKIEITDGNGKVIEGYSKDDCDIFSGDNVKHIMTWSGISKAEFNKNIKLNIYLRKAELYSFQFSDRDNLKPSYELDLNISRKSSTTIGKVEVAPWRND